MSAIPPGTKILLAAAAVAIAGYAFRFKRQTQRLDEMIAGFERLQQNALKQIGTTDMLEGIPAPPAHLPADLVYQPISEFEFSYLVEMRPDGDYMHHVIGRHAGGRGPQLSETMLVLMRRLVLQFGAAGLEHEVMLHVATLASGTQHIDFMMNPDQFSAFLGVLGTGPKRPHDAVPD